MQKQACHAFAECSGWNIVKGFSEKGVSGFKVSAENSNAGVFGWLNTQLIKEG